jgi:hypothetical protein
MITHWAHSMLFACIENVVRSHFPFNWKALDLTSLVLESAMLVQEFGVAPGTETVSITLPVVPGPLVAVSSVEQGTVMIGTPAVEECKLDLVHWHTM